MKEIKNNNINADVSGSILLHRISNRAMCLKSKSKFFDNDLRVKVYEDKIILKVADLDDRKTQKAKLQKNGWYELSIVAEKKNGKFDFDLEESDEDCRVIYCH